MSGIELSEERAELLSLELVRDCSSDESRQAASSHAPAHRRREVGRVEAQVLWAHEQGMEFPPYVLRALRESIDLYRERGFGDGV